MEPVLIYTDSQHVDAGAIQTFEMDLAFGADEQDFEVAFPSPVLSGGELLYIDGTEYGGVVDVITQSTETDNVIYAGRTWHGMLAGKIVKPPANADYYTLSGDANACISSLLTKVGLTDVLTGRSTSAGITVNYQFERFCNAYDGLLKMLASANAVLRIERHDGITELWAEPRTTITDEADSDLMDFAITDSVRVPNHLVCAGEGELQERVIVDLYADSSGNVSQTQTLTGVDEIAVLYNYNNADQAELIEEGTKELQSYQLGGGADLQVNNKGDWHVGDLIQVRDNNSGLVITSAINKKIVKVKNGVMSVDYEVGVASAQSYGGGASAETNLVTPIANGGTGATTAAGALANLGAVASQDSGWQPLKNSSNVQVGRYRKLQGVVYLSIELGAPQNISVSSSGTVLGTLPEGYRPSTSLSVGAATKGASSTSAQLSVSNAGVVTGYIFGATAIYYGAFVAFPADN